ncbi:Hypothetical protein A7982_04996 [Minicystis rosea]|nr:Hypothetical protein A7982_04996 [Minicystis rosea]
MAVVAAACAAPPPAAPPHGPMPPAPPALAAWSPLEAPPRSGKVRALVRHGDRELRLDASDTRWLHRPGAAPAHAATFEGAPLEAIALLDHGVLAVAKGGRVLHAADDLAPFQVVGDLPAGVDASTVGAYRGAITLHGARGVAFVRTDREAMASAVKEPLWLPPFEGRRAVDARIGADCAGLVVFSPQRLASTRDCGRSYQPIDDRGVHAASLLVDGDRVIVAPGGDHDVFARAFANGGARLERSLVPAGDSQAASGTRAPKEVDPRSAHQAVDRAVDTGTAIRASWTDLSSSEETKVTADGDRIFFVSRFVPLGEGRLGEGITWWHREKHWPGCSYEAVSFSACGGTRVLACGKAVHAWTGDAPGKPIEAITAALGGRLAKSVALSGPHQIFFTNDQGTWRADLRGGAAPILVRPRAAGDELRTRCDAGRRGPLWIGTRSVIPTNRAWADAPAERDTVIQVDRPVSFRGKTVVLGTARDGSLLVRDSGSSALAVLHEDGRAEARALPVTSDVAVAFDGEEHGLAIERATGRAFQSNDAGATWAETRGPGRPIGDAGLECTASRCEVEDLFVRRGWDEASPAIEPPPPPSLATKGAAPFACEADPASAPRLPAGISPLGLEPTFGPSGALWAAMAVTSGKEDDDAGAAGPIGQRTLTMLVGGADGSVQKTVAASWKGPRATTTSMVLTREGALFLWMDARGIGPNVVSAQPNALGAYAADGHAPPRRTKARFDEVAYMQGIFAIRDAPFIADSGLAVLEARNRNVLWFDERGAVTTRPWPDDAMGVEDDDAVSVDALAKRSDGTWIAIEAGRRWARVIAIAPDFVIRTRMMARERMEEQGVGILASGADVDVALVERDASGASVLRLHRVDADLGLGPPRTIPGTEAAPGVPIPLASCTGAKLPGVMDLATSIVARIGGTTAPATLSRRVRFDAGRACVERTMVTTTGEQSARVVTLGALDGPGVLSQPEQPISGARCGSLR